MNNLRLNKRTNNFYLYKNVYYIFTKIFSEKGKILEFIKILFFLIFNFYSLLSEREFLYF